MDDDVEVAVGAAVRAGLALALEAEAHPVARAGRDLHRVALRAPLAAAAAAGRARVVDHRAVPAAARARLREREQALALGLHAAPVALGADARRGPRPRAGAVAGAACSRDLHGDAGLDPRSASSNETVTCASRSGPSRGGAARRGPGRRRRARRTGRRGRPGRRCRSRSRRCARVGPPPPVRRAEAVVLLALLGSDDVVGRLDLLEALLGVVAGVPVRVELPGELAVPPS